MSARTRTALFDLFSLALWCFAFNIPGLGNLQFFRHTEADRTLIAWEMSARGDYLVPHLLGSEILTKPPLFYWLIAGLLSLSGWISEWVARFPSAFAASVLVLAQYLFVLRATLDRELALLAAIFLSTGVLTISLSSSAEIDMVFTTLNSIALYCGYFAVRDGSPRATLAVFLFAALAFLTKGAPVLPFIFLTLGFFFVTEQINTPARAQISRQFLLWCVPGVAIFCAVVCAWLIPLAQRVGIDEIIRQFRIEVFERVYYPSTHERGPFFYVRSLLVGLLPWTPVFLLGGVHLKRSEHQILLRFAAIVALLSFTILSFASGKSSRYLYPLYPFAIILCAATMCAMRKTNSEKLLFHLAALVGALGATGALVFPFVVNIPSLPSHVIFAGSAAFAGALVALFFCARRGRGHEVLLVILVIAALARISERFAYASVMNSQKQVPAAAKELHDLVPAGAPLYTVEMFERWVVYYMKRLGRVVLRVTPQIAENPPVDTAYLLLSFDEEHWRTFQLRESDPRTEIVKDIKVGKDRLILVRVAASALRALTPRSYFPTVPSYPFYDEAEQASIPQ